MDSSRASTVPDSKAMVESFKGRFCVWWNVTRTREKESFIIVSIGKANHNYPVLK